MNKPFHLQEQLHLCRTSPPVFLVPLEVLVHLPNAEHHRPVLKRLVQKEPVCGSPALFC